MKVKNLLLAGVCVAASTMTLAQAAPAAAAPASAASSAKGTKATKPAKTAAAAKPAASAADKGKTLNFGSGSGSGALLTREELRTCLTQEESIRTRLGELESRREPLNKEKQGITADQQALRTERDPIDQYKSQGDALSQRFKAFGVRVEAWKELVAKFNTDNPTGTKGEKLRTEINTERGELEKTQKELEAAKAKLVSESDEAVRTYNAKASALDGRVGDWNQRNEEWNQTSRALESERKVWVGSCADRRYREEDETAIRRGK